MPGSVSRWTLDLSRGDETAGNDICKKYWPRILAKARRLLRNESFDCDEEDLTQSVFRNALRHFGSDSVARQDTPISLWRYLETCLFHKLIDRRRHATADKRCLLADQEISLSELQDRRPPPTLQIELQDDINYLLRLLDAGSREILNLALDGHDTDEIARRLGVSSRTVQRKLVLIRDVWNRLNHSDPAGQPPACLESAPASQAIP